jgi:hypothetical protein
MKIALEIVLLTMAAVVVLDISGAALSRAGVFPRSVAFLSQLLLGLYLTGAVAIVTFIHPHEINNALLSAIFLYATLGLFYIWCKSIFSRGYSIRILLDLKEAGGKSTLEQLKDNYGGGVGMKGMLTKRLRFVSTLNLAHVSGTHYGPLTSLGRFLAVLCRNLRALLRLELVG